MTRHVNVIFWIFFLEASILFTIYESVRKFFRSQFSESCSLTTWALEISLSILPVIVEGIATRAESIRILRHGIAIKNRSSSSIDVHEFLFIANTKSTHSNLPTCMRLFEQVDNLLQCVFPRTIRNCSKYGGQWWNQGTCKKGNRCVGLSDP